MTTYQLGRILIVLIIVAITGFFSFYKKQQVDSIFVTKNLESQSYSLLKVIPDVTVLDLITNSKISLKELGDNKNSAIIVHIWGTWCGPCESEIPLFLDFVNKFDLTKFKVILIAVNDDSRKVKSFFERFNNTKGVHITIDNETTAMDRFGTFKVPETFLFNSRGILLKKYTGPQDWAQPDLLAQVKNLSNEK